MAVPEAGATSRDRDIGAEQPVVVCLCGARTSAVSHGPPPDLPRSRSVPSDGVFFGLTREVPRDQPLSSSPSGHDFCSFQCKHPRAQRHSLISETTMPTAKLRASVILSAFEKAQSELVGKAVVLTDGKAGTVEGVWLDELHGLRISIRGHDGKWPVSTIKFAQKNGAARA